MPGPSIATLHDGREVPSESPEWRLECLARAVLAKKPIEARREWLADFELKSGKQAADELRERMKMVHQSTTGDAG